MWGNLKQKSFSDFGRGTIKFESFQDLVQVENGKNLKSIATGMSCLMTIADISNEFEMFQMIDMIRELKITKKYLVILINTIDTNILGNITINFNVMIDHRKTGVLSA